MQLGGGRRTDGQMSEEEGKDRSNLKRAQRLSQCHCHVLSCLQRTETREQDREIEERQDRQGETGRKREEG